MTNQQKLVEGLGGLVVRADPQKVSAEALGRIRCPHSWATSCPTEWPTPEDCTACKRKWLMEQEGGA